MKPRKKIRSRKTWSDDIPDIYPSLLAYGAALLFCLRNAPLAARADWGDPDELIEAIGQQPESVQDVIDAILACFTVLHEIDCDNLAPGEDLPDLCMYDGLTVEGFGGLTTENLISTALAVYLKRYAPELGKEMIAKLYQNKSVKNSEPDISATHFGHIRDVPRRVSIAIVGVDKALRRYEEWKQNNSHQ